MTLELEDGPMVTNTQRQRKRKMDSRHMDMELWRKIFWRCIGEQWIMGALWLALTARRSWDSTLVVPGPFCIKFVFCMFACIFIRCSSSLSSPRLSPVSAPDQDTGQKNPKKLETVTFAALLCPSVFFYSLCGVDWLNAEDQFPHS